MGEVLARIEAKELALKKVAGKAHAEPKNTKGEKEVAMVELEIGEGTANDKGTGKKEKGTGKVKSKTAAGGRKKPPVVGQKKSQVGQKNSSVGQKKSSSDLKASDFQLPS